MCVVNSQTVIVNSANDIFSGVRKSLQQLGKFSESELEILTSKLKVKTIPKDDFILKAGKVCQSFHFVNHGSLRQYLISTDGTELTLNLFAEAEWALDYHSFTSQKSCGSDIQALEQTEVFEFDVYSLHALISQSQSFFKVAKLLESGLLDVLFYNGISSPEEKYLELLRKKPVWIQKFPLKYIASYLRMTPETLSRVRRKINRSH